MFLKRCGRHFLCSSRTLSLVSRAHIPKDVDAYSDVQSESAGRQTSSLQLSLPVVIVHGLLGSKTNWNVVASSMSTKIRQKVYAVDTRNHGESPHSEIMNYEVMADDIVEFIRHKRYDRVSLIGHSMGGKAVMTVALRDPDVVEKLVVVDASPTYSKRGEELKFLLEAMQQLDVSRIFSKTQADEILREDVPNDMIRNFLLTNLVRSRGTGRFHWKCNLSILYKSLPTMFDFPQLNSTFTGKTMFIGGARSGVIGDEQKGDIKRLFPSAEITTLDTGHWVHAEKPEEFTQIVVRFLTR